ncbi:P-loop containing nucleoside triphosphate hydrolase protein [Melanogaster broomeanus]|nr:P-loop containing nucleoside triphosphate hydrolase protein [Melanogaster broomeanus]
MHLFPTPNLPAALSSWARSSFCRKTAITRYLNQSSAAGITPAVTASLRDAFPNVQKPTAMQKKLIRAIDDTGSGKSFAVMLALLSKSRVLVVDPNKGDAKEGVTTLLIVPHRDLAYQYLHWIHHMTASNGNRPFSLAKYAQVLVRPSPKPPHILIATPNAVLDVILRRPEVLQLSTLSTVVVDEVDAFLQIPSSKLPKEHQKAAQKKLDKHVPNLARVLDTLYHTDRAKFQIFGRPLSSRSELVAHGLAPAHRPQLIMLSATLRNRLRSALYGAFGWLIRKRSLDRSAIHHVLVVSKTGDIKNIAGARPRNPVQGTMPILAEDTVARHDEDETSVFYDDDDVELKDDVDRELLMAPLKINPALLEAVAATFALDVPRMALLVLPATAPVRKIVFELQQLGVNAQLFDLLANQPSGSLRPSSSVDGIDLPELSHVFILGVPEGRMGDTYLHVAGRVGRFTGQGKVITVVEERKEDRAGKRMAVTDEPKKMSILLSLIGIKPDKLEHFD